MRALFLPILLSLGCHPRAEQARAANGTGHALYYVAWGDTLDGIAWRYAVPGGYQALARLNAIRDPDVIWAGDRLRIPRNGEITAGLPPWPRLPPVADPLAACPVERPRPSVPTPLQGCAASACADLDGARRVCSCLAPAGSSGFLVLEGSRAVSAWRTPIAADPGEDPADVRGTALDFDVAHADLDGDGRREHVVAFRTTANDVGMSWWDVAVLSGARPAVPPLQLTVANWGEGSLLAGTGPRCDLLATTWELGWEPGLRQEGWYLLGRPMRYEQGALAFVPGAPIYSRRLLASFTPGVAKTPGGLTLGRPARDLSVRGARERWTEPLAELPLWEENATVVTDLRQPPGETPVLVLDWWGSPRELTWQQWDEGFDGLGDVASRRLYPPRYRPAQPGWPAGRAALLSSYQLVWGDARNVVWLQ